MRKKILLLCFLLGSLAVFAQGGSLKINQQVIAFKATRLEINNDGMPKQCYVVDDNTGIKTQQLLFEPMHFHFYTSAKAQEKMNGTGFEITAQNADSIVWNANSTSANLKMTVQGKMLSKGVLSYHINISAIKDLLLTNMNFHIPFEKSASKYLSGLGEKGGLRPDTVRWQRSNWKKVKPNVWIGNDSLGLYFSLSKSTTLLPIGGAMQINVKGGSMLLDVHADQITLKKNEQLSFDFNLIVTPQTAAELQVPAKKKSKFYQKLAK